MSERKRGRSPGFVMSAEHRGKIQKSNILKALLEHVEGTREMSATQVTAGLGLLKKVLPDLSQVELSGDPEHPIETVTRIELSSPEIDHSTNRATAQTPAHLYRPS